MAKQNIPLRPDGEYKQLSDDERDCLTWMVLTGRSKIECFTTFVRPDLKNTKSATQWADQFFAVADVRNYIKAYEQTLKEYFNPKKKTRDRDAEAEEALTTFRDNVINAVNKSDITDVETLADQATLLNRIGMLKDEEEAQVGPIRYLPQACNDSCVYRLFCEKGIQNGDIINECDYCKALKFAKENGYIYDPTKLLDLQKEETMDNE